MKYFSLAFTLLLCFGLSLSAQNNDYSKAGDSDPAAKSILDKLRNKYNGYQALEADFTMIMELADMPKVTEKGKIARKGEQYRFEMGTQMALCDNTALWLIMHNNKMVQINDVPDEEETNNSLLSPQSLFTFYDTGKFAYQLVQEVDRGGKVIQEIEFKPLDEFADYSKLRLNVNKKLNQIESVNAFSKDGSRFTFTIDQLRPNVAFPAKYFTFAKSEFPDYDVEDLRE
ncbi:MAG: outer membrane lipoprotein carrier protein LolA [Saprospiraceae bacterium]|nr:outer membrane lipoprotein carrier protein LolA [Saprospiraceae bacterium]